MHLKPAEGTPRPVGRAIVDHLFPNGEDGRIPIVGVTGTKGMTVVARLVARLVRLSGKRVGLACRDGLYVDRRQVQKGDCTTWAAARKVLLNPTVEAAVFENDGRAIVSEGLAYDRCQVAVVTNVDETDLLPEYYIDEPWRLFNVLRTQVDVVLPAGVAVLNGRDKLAVEMAPLCDGEVIFFGLDPELPSLGEHRAQGKRTVFVRDGYVVLATGGEEVRLAEVATIAGASGEHGFQVEDVLAAVGAAWALGISLDLIRAGIESPEMA
jgi:cyanophycin synthetase